MQLVKKGRKRLGTELKLECDNPECDVADMFFSDPPMIHVKATCYISSGQPHRGCKIIQKLKESAIKISL